MCRAGKRDKEHAGDRHAADGEHVRGCATHGHCGAAKRRADSRRRLAEGDALPIGQRIHARLKVLAVGLFFAAGRLDRRGRRCDRGGVVPLRRASSEPEPNEPQSEPEPYTILAHTPPVAPSVEPCESDGRAQVARQKTACLRSAVTDYPRLVDLPEPGPLPPARSPRVLLIDSVLPIARAIASFLESFEVEIATSAASALDRLASLPPVDAVVCDLHLDGPTLYRQACARSPELRGRFVFMTGDRARSWFGIEESTTVLSRPFDHELLISVLRALLSRLPPRSEV